MNSNIFHEWFQNMQQLLEEPMTCVIVMNNASYHCVQVGDVPKSNTRKADVRKWLNEKGVDFSPVKTLAELREKVKNTKPREKRYQLDEMALKMDHKVIRLPPYHCQYNQIELIWAQVKGEIATKNTSFKLADDEKLMHEAIDAVTPDDRAKCVKHSERRIKDGFRNCVMEPVIMTSNFNDSSYSSEEDDF